MRLGDVGENPVTVWGSLVACSNMNKKMVFCFINGKPFVFTTLQDGIATAFRAPISHFGWRW